MNICELTAAVTALANAVACGMSLNELNLLAALFSQLGDTLATIAAGRDIAEEAAESPTGTPPTGTPPTGTPPTDPCHAS